MKPRRRRGTAIVDTKDGILVVSRDNRMFFLPGGGAEEGESRRDAVVRELREETGLETRRCLFLFEYPSFTADHKVFLIEAEGEALPDSEIQYLDYFDGSNLIVSSTTWEIIELYKLQKQQNQIKPTSAISKPTIALSPKNSAKQPQSENNRKNTEKRSKR